MLVAKNKIFKEEHEVTNSKSSRPNIMLNKNF